MAEHTYAHGDRVRHARDTDALGIVLHAEDGVVHVKWDNGPVIAQQPHQIIPYVRTPKERIDGLLKHATTPFIAVPTSLLGEIRAELNLLEEYKVHPLLTQFRHSVPNEDTYVPEEAPDA